MIATNVVNVGIITVLGVELSAIRTALGIDDAKDRESIGGDLFWRTTFDSAHSGTLSVIVHCIGKPGQHESAAAATKLIERFKPGVLVLVGICAGRRGMIKIGDVAIPRVVVDTTLKVALAGALHHRPKIPSLPHSVSQMLAGFDFRADVFENIFSQAFGSPLQAPSGREDEYRDHVANRPRLRDVAIASDDILIKDPDVLRDAADSIHEHIRVGEMEAAGLISACESRNPQTPWFVVRGVSDFGDELKNDDFHRLASTSAATYVKYFLASGFDGRLLGPATGHEPTDLRQSDFRHVAQLSDVLRRLQSPRTLARFSVRISIADRHKDVTARSFSFEGVSTSELLHLMAMSRDGVRHLLLHAAGGSGKSSYLREVGLEAATNRTIVPYFLEVTKPRADRLRSDTTHQRFEDEIDDIFQAFAIAGDCESFLTTVEHRPTLVIVDGLNEVPSQATRILRFCEQLAQRFAYARTAVSDRLQQREPNAVFSIAAIDPLMDAEIDSHLANRQSVLARELLNLPLFLDMELELQDRVLGTGLSRVEAFRSYFSSIVNVPAPELSEWAYRTYAHVRARAFRDPQWQTLTDTQRTRLRDSGAVQRGSSPGEWTFRHQLFHDFLVGEHVSTTPAGDWSAALFDGATFKGAEPEPLSFASEILARDDFVIAMYDWNYRVCVRCVGDVVRYRPKAISDSLTFQIGVLVQEKLLDAFEWTRLDTRERLGPGFKGQTWDFEGITSMDDLRQAVACYPKTTPDFEQWRALYLLQPDDLVNEHQLMSILHGPIIGWTTANVLKRSRWLCESIAGTTSRVCLKTMFGTLAIEKCGASKRWRLVHLFGAFRESWAIDLLFDVLGQTHEEGWVRYGALRSIVEQALLDHELLDRLSRYLEHIASEPRLLPGLRRFVFHQKGTSTWYEKVASVLEMAKPFVSGDGLELPRLEEAILEARSKLSSATT